jgi:hypothetical protein
MAQDSISRRGLFRLLKDPPLPPAANARPGLVTTETLHIYRQHSGAACGRWSEHMRRAGFIIKTKVVEDLKLLRDRLRVPPDLAACHSAEVAGYAIEGHVPAEAVKRLLSEKPNVTGLAVAGMPAGSPGVECLEEDQYDVVLFGPVTRKVYMKFAGALWIE